MHDLDFHIKRLDEVLGLILKAMRHASKSLEDGNDNPDMVMKRLFGIMAALEDAEEILTEQLDKLEE